MGDPGKAKKDGETPFGDEVAARAARKLRARRHPTGFWFGLGMMGLIGWSVVMPTLLGAGLGLWLDGKFSGRISWTLSLMLLGLALGCSNAWHWVKKEREAMEKEEEDSNHG